MSAQGQTWPRPHRLTVNDYYRMAEVGLLSPDDRTELIEGEIVDMPPIGHRHADVVRRLYKRLVLAVGEMAEVSSQQPVRLSLRSEPQPDFALLRPGDYRSAHPGPSDVELLIEVSDSTLRYDLDVKARLYAEHSIPEYWVVDLIGSRLVRHRAPRDGQYTQLDEIRSGTLSIPPHDVEIVVGDW